jgi:flagellar basal-body rod modification protein FlgD
MSIDQISSSSIGINAILGGQSNQVEEKEDPLGRDAFLTMLVAQLKHQDPLNPMEGADFSAQLAQFSTLEQMFNVNDSLDNIETALASSRTEQNLLDFIGKEVTCESNSLSLVNGDATGGYYTIGEKTNILINVYDDMGAKVTTVIGGQKEAGTHAVEWDGINDLGEMMPDGSYSYDVLAVDENYGIVEVDTVLSGTVTGITYEHGSAYLLIGDQLVDPATVIKVNQETAGA